MTRGLRVGVLGLGFGAAVHVPALSDLPDVTLVGLGGRDLVKTTTAVARLGLEAHLAVKGIDELLDRRPDAVMLAVPPDQSEQLALKAIAAGCAVLCEKPLASTAAAARHMADVATRAGVLTGVNFQFAELPAFQQLAAATKDQRIGAVRHVNVTWLVQSYAQQHGIWSWKTDAAAGGGVLALLGSHLLYLAEWLWGPAVQLWAAFDASATRAFAPTGAEPAEDMVQLRLVHASGTILTATIGNSSSGLHRHLWHIGGTTGSLILDNPTADYMKGFALAGNGSAEGIAFQDQVAVGDGRVAPFRSLAGRFLETVRHGGKFLRPSFNEGARVQYLMEAARASAVGDRTMAVAESEPVETA